MRRPWIVVGVVVVLAVGIQAYGQAVAKTVLSLFRIYAIDPPLDVIGGVETEPVRTGRIEPIDGGFVAVPALDAGHVATGIISNVDGGLVLVRYGAQADPFVTGSIMAVDGGYVSVPAVDAGYIAVLDMDLHNAALPACTMALDGHRRGTAAGDWVCVGVFGKWARQSPVAVSLYFTGNEPGTFKGPAEGRRFFIQPAAAVGEPLRCFAITATVNAVGSCVGACAALPAGQQVARVAFGQDIAGNLCYADVPCTAALESVVSSADSACGVDAGTTGVRSFFWIEPTASNCTESPVLNGSIVCNVTDS